MDTDLAEAAIASAVARVKSVARQQFDFVAGDVIEIVGGERVLTLPQRPVVVDQQNPLTVDELDVGGRSWRAVEGQFWYREGDRLVRQWPTQWVPAMQVPWAQEVSQLWAPMRPPGVWAPRVRVTYSHGYRSDAELPPGLADVVLDAAVALAVNPQGIRSEQVGGIRVEWGRDPMQARDSLEMMIREKLRLLGIRRGGMFSIGTR